MSRIALVLAVVAVAVGAVALALAATGDGDGGDDPTSVTVRGTAERRVAPDVATLTLGVTLRRPTAEAATTAASDALGDVIAAVREIGVTELQTQPVRVRRDEPPRTPEGGPQQTRGSRPFVARQAITVRMRALDDVGQVIDAAVAAGATDVDGPRFSLGDPARARRRALAAAVADAREAARVVADAAGRRLGEVQKIQTRDVSGPEPRFARAEAAAVDAAPPVEPGMVPVTATVTATFATE